MTKTAEEVFAEPSSFTISKGVEVVQLTKGDMEIICDALNSRICTYLAQSVRANEDERPFLIRFAVKAKNTLQKVTFQKGSMDYSEEDFHRVVKNHIKRFESRIASGHQTVNKSECQNYLNIWKSIQAKGYTGSFTREEQDEITDAYFSGE
jgi:hypothetical protein